MFAKEEVNPDNLFDQNILKNENPPKFLVITNIEDETGSKMRLGRFRM